MVMIATYDYNTNKCDDLHAVKRNCEARISSGSHAIWRIQNKDCAARQVQENFEEQTDLL